MTEIEELEIRIDEIGRQPASLYGRRRLDELKARLKELEESKT